MELKERKEENIKLTRVMSSWDATAYIICGVIGSGIFISLKPVLELTGSTGMALVMWLVTGLINILMALCYADLALTFPQTGADYIYLREGYGEWAGFLFFWTSFVFIDGASRGVIALTFSTYFCQMFFTLPCSVPAALEKLVAGIALTTLSVVQCYSSKFAVKLSGFFTIAKLLGLVIIISIGLGFILAKRTENLDVIISNTSTNIGDYLIAFYTCNWAYGGLNTALNVVEEVKEPVRRNILTSIFLSHVLIIIVYLLTNLAYITVVSPDEILATNAIAMTVTSKVFSGLFWLMPFFVACSTFGTLNNGILNSARLVFAASKIGHMPQALGLLHKEYLTPIPALMINLIITLTLLSLGNISELILYTGYTSSLVMALSVGVCIVNRFKKTEGSFKLPIFVPILTLFILTILLVYPFYQAPVATIVCFGFISSGIPIYLFIRIEKKPEFLKKIEVHVTRFTQILCLGLSPSEDNCKVK